MSTHDSSTHDSNNLENLDGVSTSDTAADRLQPTYFHYMHTPQNSEIIQSTIQNQINIDRIRGYNFWVKFAAFLHYLNAFFLLIPLSIFVITIPLGILHYISGRWLWISGDKIGSLEHSNDIQDYLNKTLAGIGKMRNYQKTIGIFTVFTLLFQIFLVFLVLSFLLTGTEKDKTDYLKKIEENLEIQDSSSSTRKLQIDDNYRLQIK